MPFRILTVSGDMIDFLIKPVLSTLERKAMTDPKRNKKVMNIA
jgi:hypothetical protein